MKVNVAQSFTTHEGGKAVQTNAYERLKRTVLACLLFEDTFYEDGKSSVERIKELSAECKVDQVLELAILASEKYRLRHVPLQLLVESLKHQGNKEQISKAINIIVKRADQMTDLLALYWKDGKKPIANQLKKGLAQSFQKWDEYQLSKYNRHNPIKLKDVLFLCHAKPIDEAQGELWKRLVDNKLAIADTWETRLSSGADKKESFQELLESNKMGKLAILRNLRNMEDAGVSRDLVSSRLLENKQEMLPFQYLAAAREVPLWEDLVDASMIQDASRMEKLKGKTLVLVDVSGSMIDKVSGKSTMTRQDAAAGLAILLRECCDYCEIMTFSNQLAPVPPRRGMALRDAIDKSQPHNGTYLGNCLTLLLSVNPEYDRLIVITDEQTQDNIPQMRRGNNYILNVGTYQNGIGNKNQWLTISGFSEASVNYIREVESQE